MDELADILLCEISGSREWLPEIEGGRENYYFMGIEFPFHKTKRVVEVEGGDGCTTV